MINFRRFFLNDFQQSQSSDCPQISDDLPAARRESGDKPPVHVKGRHSVSASLTSGGQEKASDQRKLGSQDAEFSGGWDLGETRDSSSACCF